MDLQQEIIVTRGMLAEMEETQARLLSQAQAAKTLYEGLTSAASTYALNSDAPIPAILVGMLNDLNELNAKLRGEVWFLFKEEQKAADEEDRLARRLDALKAEQVHINDLGMAFYDAAEEMGVR